MREFKVIRMNAAGTKLVEEELMFQDIKAADKWAERKNKEKPGSVIDIQETGYDTNIGTYEGC